MSKKVGKEKKDRILQVAGKSPLITELYPDWEDEELNEFETELQLSAMEEDGMTISGELGLGGNPVTIIVIDEVSGMEMELSHVKNALLIVEDRRKSSSGWLSLMIGDVEKVGEVLRFIAKATVKELKRLIKRANKKPTT